ncbi:MAG: indole-3-glycerol phosphate synthase TrpC [bacterium]|nr:indole-3-glycerol phosphate synthase TrpC [bacterium]
MITLEDILIKKRQRLEATKKQQPLVELKKALAVVADSKHSLVDALTGKDKVNVIAEYKTASPSGGVLIEQPNLEKIIASYISGGATAISVLTEQDFFLGNLSRLSYVKSMVDVPVLRKDFIIDPYQIYESKVQQADAILLIANILSAEQLLEFSQLAKELKLDVLFEIHDEQDLEKVLACKPRLIGVNARDLSTMEVDLRRINKLIKKIPDNITIVAESGITTKQDIDHLKDLGVSAALIGTTLIKSDDPQGKLHELLGIDDNKQFVAKQQCKVKVCGITNEADAFLAVQCGANYLGYILNYPNSSRFISISDASKIIKSVSLLYPDIKHVGVFVDATVDTITRMQKQLDLDVVQLHGDESIEEVRAIGNVEKWKAVEIHHTSDVSLIEKYIDDVDAIVVDAGKGSGKRIDHDILQQIKFSKQLVLAGGLAPDNVRMLVADYRPAIVDVSSGVEAMPGKKDRAKLEAFFEAVLI